MASISDLIAKEFGRVGQPGRQTTTQVSEQPRQPLDILSAIMLMLYSGVFDKKGGGGLGEGLGGGELEQNPFISLFGGRGGQGTGSGQNPFSNLFGGNQ